MQHLLVGYVHSVYSRDRAFSYKVAILLPPLVPWPQVGLTEIGLTLCLVTVHID